MLLALLDQIWHFSQESLLASRFKEDADFAGTLGATEEDEDGEKSTGSGRAGRTPGMGETGDEEAGCGVGGTGGGGAAESLKARLLHRRRELGRMSSFPFLFPTLPY